MRIIIIAIIYLINVSVFSQKLKTQYFFIDINDTLIKTQISTKKNKFQGYEIINENKIIKKYIKTSKIDDDDVEVEIFDSIMFTFNKEKDTIVDEAYLKEIKFTKNRKEFLKINTDLNESENRFIFIIPTKCNNFILRNVRPLIFE